MSLTLTRSAISSAASTLAETASGLPAPTWQFVLLEQFSRPQPPPAEFLRSGIGGIIASANRFRRSLRGALAHTELTAVPPYLLERIAAPPGYARQIDALEAALADWTLGARPDAAMIGAVRLGAARVGAVRLGAARPGAVSARGKLQVVVSPPASGLDAVLAGWARRHSWWNLEPPGYDCILEGGQAWLENFAHNPEKPLLIPDLARLYLRHHNGLDLVRRLLDHLWTRPGLCLIGCDSWAWAYLSQALQIDTQLPPPLAQAACDSDHLLAWLGELAAGAEKFGFSFRQANNGKYVLQPRKREMVDMGDYLKHLAAFCRGNPGLAWAVWRSSLQYGANAEVDPKALVSAGRDSNRTIWVKNLSSLKLPDLPGATQDKLFVLHALLLHAGLPVAELTRLLPLSPAEIMRAVHILHNAGLIQAQGERWQVSPLGYPAVRQILSQEGYLVDAF